jgi:hypothetical protein
MHAMDDGKEKLPLFGIGGPFDSALATALRNYRRRGAPVTKWRIELREPMRTVMTKCPDASDAEIARILWEDELRKSANISIRTIQNWLSVIRRGGVGYGRERR